VSSSLINPATLPASHLDHEGKLPELLAPAGDWECARAAVENGADAIYFGLERFNARVRANNFTEADLPRLMEFLHHRGVKGYVTFNTLVFQNEMPEAEQYARTIIASGADAAIVQDVGICRLIRQLSSNFPIHVSTQMTVTSAGGIEFARDLGCNLVVLARECSLKEIEQIRCSPGNGVLPLEVFVHGALCVAYSGQCLTSEALGGRSANRGECAQACRMPYELLSDGRPVPLGDRKYLLSPQDLAGLELLPEVVRLGVASLKIEGRLKSPEYVANITRVYRQALDAIAGAFGHPGNKPPASEEMPQQETRYRMEMAFSRGLHTGWFGGSNNQELVHGRFGTKRGVYLGAVAEVRHESVLVHLEGPLKPGDGVVFDAGKPEFKEEGGRVYELHRLKTRSNAAPLTEIRFGRGDIAFNRVHQGDKLWKTSDPDLDRRLRQTFQGTTPKFLRHVTGEVHGRSGQPLTLLMRDETGRVAQAVSTMPLVEATHQPLTTDRLSEQLGRIKGSGLRLDRLINNLEGGVILPLSELNRMRRDVVAELERLRRKPLAWDLREVNHTTRTPHHRETEAPSLGSTEAPSLIVLARSMDQLEAAVGAGVRKVYCEFEDLKKYREAVKTFRILTEKMGGGAEIFAAPPRIFKMGEEWTLNQVRSSEANGFLVRNYDHLRFFKGERGIGDYSLNVANTLAAEHFRDRFGLERLTASYDLNFTQLEALLQAAPPGCFEVTIHQHMPMFHMEHCVFCAFLTKGKDYRDCGRPCDRHDLKLRDRVGMEHPVKADAGCRNTVFNGRAQTGAEYVKQMLGLGVRFFRIEFVNETREQTTRTVSMYRRLLDGKIAGDQLWRELKLFNQLGVTRGQIGG
jgi:U32 family peptidase